MRARQHQRAGRVGRHALLLAARGQRQGRRRVPRGHGLRVRGRVGRGVRAAARQQRLQRVPGRAALVRDIGRVLRPGGRLLIVDRSLGLKEISALLDEVGFTYGDPNPLEGNAYTMIATRRPATGG